MPSSHFCRTGNNPSNVGIAWNAQHDDLNRIHRQIPAPYKLSNLCSTLLSIFTPPAQFTTSIADTIFCVAIFLSRVNLHFMTRFKPRHSDQLRRLNDSELSWLR